MYVSKFKENNNGKKITLEEADRTMTCQEYTVNFFCCYSYRSFLVLMNN